MKAILFAWTYNSHVALKNLGYLSQQKIAFSEEFINRLFNAGLDVALVHDKNSENVVYVGADFNFPELAVDMGIKGGVHTRPLEE